MSHKPAASNAPSSAAEALPTEAEFEQFLEGAIGLPHDEAVKLADEGVEAGQLQK